MEKSEKELQAEVNRLQKQVSNLEKLSSLGMLSAGIAHEIQNPLNFVINFSKMSCRLLEDLQEILQDASGNMDDSCQEEINEVVKGLEENLDKISGHGERAISIIRGILLYSRGKENEFVDTDICKLVREYVWLAYHAMRANDKELNIAIREEYAEGIPVKNVIPQDFSRVVLNLMNNACYAVKQKAALGLSGYQPEIRVCVRPWEEGFSFCLEDNGTGMPEEVRQKVFTAFFTTKPVGEGTGLGLSIVRSIVEEKHKGRITMESVEGEGTKFIIRIK